MHRITQLGQARALNEFQGGCWSAATYYRERHAIDAIVHTTGITAAQAAPYAAQWLEAYAQHWATMTNEEKAG